MAATAPTTTTTTTTTGGSSTTNETDEFIKKSRVTRAAPPKPAYDPLQFVQIKPVKLYDMNKAKPSTERKVVEVKTPREVEDAEEWQCNLDNWKSSRRKRVEHIIDKITEAKKIEQEEVCRGRKKSKTFSEMLENSGSRRRFILPGAEDDEDGSGSFSDDLQDNRDSTKQQYKDETGDDRTTDDASSCCSSKLTDGESKTPDLEDSQEIPEMNEFSLAIENYKSKFPMTQNRTSSLVGGGGVLNITTTTSSTTISTSVVSSIESNNEDNYGSNNGNSIGDECTESREQQLTSSASCEALEGTGRPPMYEEESSSRKEADEAQPEAEEKRDEPAKVNVIERRRLFEQFQQLSVASDVPASTPCLRQSTGGGQDEPRWYSEGTQSSTGDEPAPAGIAESSAEWFSAGSIKERRAIFERYHQSNETVAEEEHESVGGGGRSRNSNGSSVMKSRSESNFGFVNGSTGRFELTLSQLKRSGAADCCEDSGIQSTTDLSRSSVVSQADEHDPSSSPPLLLHLHPEDGGLGKSPIRSVTLDSASEFSDTDCSNGQLLENALDVAFEEMDSELNESCTMATTTSEQQAPEQSNRQDSVAEVVAPLPVLALASSHVAPDAELMVLPQSVLTPPKEKPPPPPIDDEAEQQEQEQQRTPSALATAGITSWMQRNDELAAMQQTASGASLVGFYEQTAPASADPSIRRDEDEFQLQLADEQWRSLESYEVVQQVVHQQQQHQQQVASKEQQQELDMDQQELLVYNNQIETPHHHHQLYDPGEHEEIVSVERELLQIEQEELQRRREKQMFYEKLSNTDTTSSSGRRAAEQQLQHHQHQQQQQQQHQTQIRMQQQQQSLHHQQQQRQHHQQQEPSSYSYEAEAHHHNHHHHHHPHANNQHQHHRNRHHRASMPAIDSRSLQNVNSYGSYETPFADDVGATYEMGSLHRESMPNLSHVATSSSHPSSLSSYGEEAYSATSATSFDGTTSCWTGPVEHRPGRSAQLYDRRPLVAPRPVLNGFLERPAMGGGERQRMSNTMFEQQPKDIKQNSYQSMMANRGGQMGGGGGGGASNTMPYGQHWLVQEAEQRRIEQHQKNANSSSSNTTKRPLPKFVIDAITQRVQKLNAGSPEYSDRSNLSEDSDLAMLHSMKHHHQHHQHHQQQQQQQHHQPHQLPPVHHHQHQQQQQQYSNASDKVLSVSGKKECSHCRIELGKGAAMAIESLGLFYHIECFKCCVCHVKLGDGTNGIDVRVRKYRLHCQNCFSSEDGVKFSCV